MAAVLAVRWAAALGGVRARRIRLAASAGVLYVVLALGATWPLVTRLSEALPQGTDRAATLPFFHAWVLWWTSDRIAGGLAGFWDAPIFFPTGAAFLFSDPQVLTGLIAAPLFGAGANPALAHNLVLLLALVSNGALACMLLRCVGLHPATAVAGGAMMLMLPYVHHELGVLMLVNLAGILGTLWALVAFVHRPSLSGGLWLGIAAAATYLMCSQYGVFLGLVIAPAALWLGRREHYSWRSLLYLLAGVGLCALLVAPVALPQLDALQQHGFVRSEALALQGSSRPMEWVATTWRQLVPLPGIVAVDEVWMRAHFPGTLKLVLAILGLSAGLQDRQMRRWTIFLLSVSVLACLLSALPRIELLGFSPYRVMRNVIGIEQMRSFWRFAVVAQIAMVLLAAQGLEPLVSFVKERWGSTTALARTGVAAVFALGLVAAVELWPDPQSLAQVPDFERWRPWTNWMTENLEPNTAIVHLPFPGGSGVTDFEETSRWMYLTAAHRHPIVNGYSGFFPEPYRVLTKVLSGCPVPESYEFLRGAALETLVIRSSWLQANSECGPPADTWQRVLRLDALDLEVHLARH